MNAVERIEAAIQKLEALKEESSTGPWEWRGDRSKDEASLYGDDGLVIAASGMHTRGFIYVEAADAELIVLLHRTIDAQLAILTCVLRMEGTPGLRFNPLDHTAFALADAILGDAS